MWENIRVHCPEVAEFYDAWPLADFMKRIAMRRLYDESTGECCDLTATASLLKKQSEVSQKYETLMTPEGNGNVLIAGIGFGREVDWLLKKTNLKIHGIDISEKLLNKAKEKFDTDSRVCIEKCDILDIPSSLEKFDLVLWMFSGITEFLEWEENKKQKSLALKNLAGTLNTDGVLVVETICQEKDVAVVVNNNICSSVSSGENPYFFTHWHNGKRLQIERFQNEEQLEQLAEAAGLKRLGDREEYLDDGKQKRELNLFVRK